MHKLRIFLEILLTIICTLKAVAARQERHLTECRDSTLYQTEKLV